MLMLGEDCEGIAMLISPRVFGSEPGDNRANIIPALSSYRWQASFAWMDRLN